MDHGLHLFPGRGQGWWDKCSPPVNLPVNLPVILPVNFPAYHDQ